MLVKRCCVQKIVTNPMDNVSMEPVSAAICGKELHVL